jgi:hypothetical protein
MPEFVGARVLREGVAGGRLRIPTIQGVTDQVQRLAIPLWVRARIEILGTIAAEDADVGYATRDVSRTSIRILRSLQTEFADAP